MTKITEYERGRESMLADVRQWLEGLARHSASAFPSNSSSLLEAEGSGAGLASRGWPHAAPPVQLPPDELEVGDWVEVLKSKPVSNFEFGRGEMGVVVQADENGVCIELDAGFYGDVLDEWENQLAYSADDSYWVGVDPDRKGGDSLARALLREGHVRRIAREVEPVGWTRRRVEILAERVTERVGRVIESGLADLFGPSELASGTTSMNEALADGVGQAAREFAWDWLERNHPDLARAGGARNGDGSLYPKEGK